MTNKITTLFFLQKKVISMNYVKSVFVLLKCQDFQVQSMNLVENKTKFKKTIFSNSNSP